MLSTAVKPILTIGYAFALGFSQPALAAPEKPAAQVVARLYKDFGWQAFATQSTLFGDGLAFQTSDALNAYFSPELAELIARDNACMCKEKSLCRLDFDILLDGGATDCRALEDSRRDLPR